ncbi:hypothetical protein [Oscillibacter sp.]|uniref:hypothetical protein n=1 Tax=Oscillibacter sp. TaxID=1945593 RepID=UPI003398F418
MKMKDKWKLFNIALTVLVIVSLTFNIVLFTQLSAEKKTLSSLQENLSSSQEKLDTAKEKLAAIQDKIEVASNKSDDTATPLSDATVLANGTTLGDAKKVIDGTRSALKDMGYTDKEITPQLESLAVQLGTTLTAIESVSETVKNQEKQTTSGSTATTPSKNTTPTTPKASTPSSTASSGASDAGDKNHNGINDAFEGCTITDEQAAGGTSEHSNCGTLQGN